MMHGEMEDESSEGSLYSSESESDFYAKNGSIAEDVLIHGVHPQLLRRNYEGSVISGTERSFRTRVSDAHITNPEQTLSGVLQGALDIDELLSDDSEDDDELTDSHHALYLEACQQRYMIEAAFKRHNAENEVQTSPSMTETQHSEKSEEQKRTVTSSKEEKEEKKATKSGKKLRFTRLEKVRNPILSSMKKPTTFRTHGILKGKNELKGGLTKKSLLVGSLVLLGIIGIIVTTVLIIIFGKAISSGASKEIGSSFLRSSYDRP